MAIEEDDELGEVISPPFYVSHPSSIAPARHSSPLVPSLPCQDTAGATFISEVLKGQLDSVDLSVVDAVRREPPSVSVRACS